MRREFAEMIFRAVIGARCRNDNGRARRVRAVVVCRSRDCAVCYPFPATDAGAACCVGDVP